MAPLELQAPADEGGAGTAALAMKDPAELWELGLRLAQERAALERRLGEALAEQQRLRVDNAGLRSTIELMIGHLKLNISAGSVAAVSDTQHSEAPLDILGRFWRGFGSRSSSRPAIRVSEHIGEIRRCRADRPSLAPAVAAPRCHSLVKQKTGPTKTSAAFPSAWEVPRKPQKERVLFTTFLGFLGVSLGDGCDAHGTEAVGGGPPPACPKPVENAAEVALEPRREAVGGPPPAGPKPAENAAEVASEPRREAMSGSLPAGPKPVENAADVASELRREAEQPSVPSHGHARPQGEEKDAGASSSTVLIEARLLLDGVGLATCRVHAEDRCREVAARFVDEYSLKACFEAPLAAYLMKAEAEALRFPIVLDADLLDIRRQFGSQGQ